VRIGSTSNGTDGLLRGEAVRYAIIILGFVIWSLPFALSGKAPLLYMERNQWGYGSDTYHTIMMLYKTGESFFNGFTRWDFNNGLGAFNAGYIIFPDFNPAALIHFLLVSKLGLPLFETAGWMIACFYLFAAVTFYYYLRKCLEYSGNLALLGVMILVLSERYNNYVPFLNYSGIFCFLPLALIAIHRFAASVTMRNTVILAFALAFPAFFGMINIYLNFLLLCGFMLIFSLKKAELPRQIGYAFAAGVLCLFLTVYVWLPFLVLNCEFAFRPERTAYEILRDIAIRPGDFLLNLSSAFCGWGYNPTMLTYFSGAALVPFLLGFFRERTKVAGWWYLLLLVSSFVVYGLHQHGLDPLVVRSLKFLKYQSIIGTPLAVILFLEGVRFLEDRQETIARFRPWIIGLGILCASIVGFSALGVTGNQLIIASVHAFTWVAAVAALVSRYSVFRYLFVASLLVSLAPFAVQYNLLTFGHDPQFYAVTPAEQYVMRQSAAEKFNFRSYYTEDFGFLSNDARRDFIVANRESLSRNDYFRMDYDPIVNSRKPATRIREWKMYWNNFETKIPTADGGNFLLSNNVRVLGDAFFRKWASSYGACFDIEDPTNPIFSSLFGLKYILSPFPVIGALRLVDSPGTHWRYVHELPNSRPVVQFPVAVRVLPSQSDVLDLMKDAFARRYALDPATSFTAASDIGAQCHSCVIPVNEGNRIDDIHYGNDSLEIAVTTARDGFLEINQGFNRYWRATADGRTEPLIRTNYAASLVRVRKGDRMVKFMLEVPIFRTAGIINGLVFAACTCFVILRRKVNPDAVGADA
jgi:hypothetical protein